MPTIALARAKLVVPVRGKPRLTRNDQPSSGAGRGGSGASHVSVDGKARSAGMPPHFDTSLSATGERDSDHAETCEKQDSNLRQSMRACAGKAGHVRSSRPDLARASLGLDMNVVMNVGMCALQCRRYNNNNNNYGTRLIYCGMQAKRCRS